MKLKSVTVRLTECSLPILAARNNGAQEDFSRYGDTTNIDFCFFSRNKTRLCLDFYLVSDMKVICSVRERHHTTPDIHVSFSGEYQLSQGCSV